MRRYLTMAFLVAGLMLEGYNAWLSRTAQHDQGAGTVHAMEGATLPPPPVR